MAATRGERKEERAAQDRRTLHKEVDDDTRCRYMPVLARGTVMVDAEDQLRLS